MNLAKRVQDRFVLLKQRICKGKVCSLADVYISSSPRRKKKILYLSASILVVLIPVLIFSLKKLQKAEAAWWNEEWMYRVPIRVSNPSGSSGTDLENVQVRIAYSDFSWTFFNAMYGTMKDDASDVRFTSQNGEELSYWVEDKNDSGDTIQASSGTVGDIWVNIPLLPKGGTVIYMYYGNPSAISKSNGNNVFDFFDDFNTPTLDSVKWDGTSGSITISNGNLALATTGTKVGVSSQNIYTIDTYANNQLFIRAKESSTAINAARLGFSNTKSFSSNYNADDSAAFLFDSTTGGKFEVEVTNEGSIDTGDMDFSTEDTSSDNFVINLAASISYTPDLFRMWFGDSYSDYSDISYGILPDESMYIRLESTSTTGTMYIDSVYLVTSPLVTGYLSLSDYEKSKGPVAYWKFDEGYGTTAYDQRNVYNATLAASTATPSWKTSEYCVSGYCLFYDGSNDYISVGSTVPSIKTVSFWVKPTTTTEYFINLDGGSNYISSSSGTVSATGFTSPTIYVDGKVSSTIVANKWQHVVVTTDTAETGSSIRFGNISTNYLEGFIDEVKFYQYVRTADEVKTDYNSVSGASTVLGTKDEVFMSDGLVGYWKLDESSGNASDYSGNNYTLTNNGTTTYVAGKFNKGSEHVPASTQYFSLGTDGTSQDTYYFDVSDGGPTEQGQSKWIDDANAFDGSTSTYASTNTNGTDSQYYLLGEGTDAPGSGNTIESVKARIYGCSSYMSGSCPIYAKIYTDGLAESLDYAWVSGLTCRWGDYFSLSTPTAGWSWPTIQSLETKLYAYNDGGCLNFYFARAYKIEALVTTSTSTMEEISDIKSVSFWANPDSTTNYYLALDGTHYVTSTSGTLAATGFTNPIIYVNGVESSTIVANTWQLVTITSDTAIDASQFYVGRVGSSYYDGTLDEVRLYNKVLSSSEVQSLYNWAPGPISYHPLDENTGTTSTYDKSSNGYTGTLTSIAQTSWVPGKMGSALKLDGAADFIDIGTGPSVVNTVSFWVNPTTTTEYFVDLNGSAYIRSSSGTVSATGFTSPVYYINGVKTTSPTIAANTWTHVTVTTATSLNATDYDIGRIEGTGYLEGIIDEVKLYNYVRSDSQVLEDMNAGHPAPGSPVGSAKAHWKFDRGYGDTAYNSGNLGSTLDSSLSGTNTCPGHAACPTWSTSGKFGTALDFDGGDYVQSNTADIFSTDSKGTVAAWIYPKNFASGVKYIFSSGDNASANRIIGFAVNASGQPYVLQQNSDVYDSVGSSNALALNTWSHVVWMSDGTTYSIYINGVLQPLTVFSGSNTGDWFADATARDSFTIGALGWNSSIDLYFNGLIDDLLVYGDTLTANQIKILYNNGKATVMGATSTTSTGTPDTSSDRSYCPPGDTTSSCGPIAHWTFDENTGTTSVYDSSGNNYTGTMMGSIPATAWRPGKVGSALYFDGTNDYISVGSSFQIPSQYGTVSLWLNPELASGFYDILSSGTNLNDFRMSPLNNLYGFYIGAEYRVSYATDPPTNQCTHVTLTWDQTNGSILYYNGIKVASNSTPPPAYNQTGMYIGADPGAGQNFKGTLDDLKVYDYARDPAQIAWDYNRGKPGAHYKFDECQGTDAHDSGCNNLHGTITPGASGNTSAGTCTSGTSTHMWYNGAEGKYNYSLDFDGIDDFVSVSANSAIDMYNKTSYSVCSWVYPNSDGESDTGRFFSKGNSYVRVDSQSGSTVKVSASFDLATTDATYTSTRTIPTGAWSHICVTYMDDADDEITIYINGKLEGSSTNGVGSPTSDTSSTLYIGGNNGATTFDGKIDDVKIFNYELTDELVKQQYQQGAAVRFGPTEGAPD